MSTASAGQMQTQMPCPIIDVPEQKRGIGILELLGPQGRVELPLAGVSISAKVSSFVAQVTVEQTFKNPSTESLEAEYVFPLAGACAVGHFELHVAGRVIVGKVEERGEARRQYQEAIAQGKRAALLEQERSNVFTVKVGNLPPGEEAKVILTYSERLSFFEDGSGELRLPLVVAPRYMAGEEQSRAQSGSGVMGDTDKVPDASRLSPPRLAPGFDAKVALKLQVELLKSPGDANGFDALACSQHATKTAMSGDSIKVELSRAEKLDRDFVLRWRMGGPSVSSSMQVYTPAVVGDAKKEDAFALVTLVPPRREGFLGMPREVVFVVDRSGSMEGVKMTSAASACALLLRTLGPRDRFAIQAFDNVCDWMEGGKFLAGDEAGIEKGEAFLRGINARGGTELDLAMNEALGALTKRKESPRTEAAQGLPIVVLLTDGQVGDESSVLRRLQTTLGEARVFTIGIDSAVNDGFLRRLSVLGGGTATFVEPGSALEEALRAVGREIGAPLITNLELFDDGSGLDAESLAPQSIPDLFEGRATSVFVRVQQAKGLTLTGKYADGTKFKASLTAQPIELPAMAQLWAKARVTDLEDRFRLSNAGAVRQSAESIKSEIVELACKHTLLTRFTAFIAVDQEIVNPGGKGKKQVQPVEMPAGWDMKLDAAGPLAGQALHGAMNGPPMKMPPPPPHSPPAARPATVAAPMPAMPMPAAEAFSEMGSLASSAPASAPKGMGSGFGSSSGAGGPQGGASHRSRSMAQGKKMKSAASGLLSKVANAIGSIGGTLKEMGEDGAADDRDESESGSPEEIAAVRTAIAKLGAALDAVQSDLKAGKRPTGSALEAARDELLKLLSTFAGATQLPLLQRFLRTGAAELIAALHSNADAKSLEPLAVRHAQSFAAARTEADSALGNAPAAKPAVWEASI